MSKPQAARERLTLYFDQIRVNEGEDPLLYLGKNGSVVLKYTRLAGTKTDRRQTGPSCAMFALFCFVEKRSNLTRPGIRRDAIETTIHEVKANHKLETAERETRGEAAQQDQHALHAVDSGPSGAAGVMGGRGGREMREAGPGVRAVQ